MQWAFGLFLASIAYLIARSILFLTADGDAPRWEFHATKFFQIALVPLFAYGLYYWLKGLMEDIAETRK